MAPANDNMTAQDDPEATLADAIGHYPWLTTEAAALASEVIAKALVGVLGTVPDHMSALPIWILEDLAVAGLKVVRADGENLMTALSERRPG